MTHVLAFFALFTVLQDVRRKMWPEQARRDLFIKYLKDTYDYQLLRRDLYLKLLQQE